MNCGHDILPSHMQCKHTISKADSLFKYYLEYNLAVELNEMEKKVW